MIYIHSQSWPQQSTECQVYLLAIKNEQNRIKYMKHLLKLWDKTQHLTIIHERRITPELSPTFPSIFYLGTFKLLLKDEELPEKTANLLVKKKTGIPFCCC